MFVIFESNLAFEAQHLHAVETTATTRCGISNWVSLSEGQQQAHGWLTSTSCRSKVPAGARRSPWARLPTIRTLCTELGVHKAKLQLQDGLASYCVMVEPPKTTFEGTQNLHGQGPRCVPMRLALF